MPGPAMPAAQPRYLQGCAAGAFVESSRGSVGLGCRCFGKGLVPLVEGSELVPGAGWSLSQLLLLRDILSSAFSN